MRVRRARHLRAGRGDDDVLRWREEIDPSERELAQEAADACPMLAIRLEG
jgi:ferredoxin